MPWIKVKEKAPPGGKQGPASAERKKRPGKSGDRKRSQMSAFEKLFSHHPEMLAPFKQWEHQVRQGGSGLSEVQREMIATVVSQSNGCIFCTMAHGRLVKKLTKDSSLYENLIRDFRQASLPAADQMMLAFATKLSLQPQNISPEDIQKLRENDFDDGAITDIVMMISLMSAVNRIFKGLGEDVSPKKLEEAKRLGMPIPAHYFKNIDSGD